MAEYIDRNALLQKIRWASDAEEAVISVRRMPAADVAEVVRCRECKFRSSWMMNRNLRYICPESGMFPNCENDFCSYGKRKEGDD